MQKMVIVGIFYDRYYDLWEDFLELFSQNWPNCPYPVYIVNGEKDLNYDKAYNVNVIHAGADAEYSLRVQKAVSQIDSEYYLLLLEDFFFEHPIVADPIEEILNTMISNNLSYLRMTLPEFLVGIKPGRYKRDLVTGFSLISHSDEYTVTCQPSIWKRDFLEQCIGTGNYNAWVFEGMYSYSKTAHTSAFLDKCRIDLTNPLGLRHGAVQGKILPNVYSDITKTGYEFKSSREILSDNQYQKHIKKQKIKSLIPKLVQLAIKKLIKSDSVVDRYKEEIVSQMKIIGLE